MKLTSIATETPFLNEQDGELEEERNDEEDMFIEAHKMDESNKLESEIEASNKLNVGNAASGDKRKVVVAPPRKAEQVRFNKQGSSENSKWLKTSRQNLTKEQQNDD